jgi:hypothetical protein
MGLGLVPMDNNLKTVGIFKNRWEISQFNFTRKKIPNNWLYSVDDIVYNWYEIWASSEEDIFSGAKFAEL